MDNDLFYSSKDNDFLRVIIYIIIGLFSLHFSIYKDIFNYRDISLIFFFNNGLIFFLVNVYSDLSQLALKYFKNTEANINNILIVMGRFGHEQFLFSFPFIF